MCKRKNIRLDTVIRFELEKIYRSEDRRNMVRILLKIKDHGGQKFENRKPQKINIFINRTQDKKKFREIVKKYVKKCCKKTSKDKKK